MAHTYRIHGTAHDDGAAPKIIRRESLAEARFTQRLLLECGYRLVSLIVEAGAADAEVSA